MKVSAAAYLLLSSLWLEVTSGLSYAMPYDYSASKECLAEPRRAHYRGGIVMNPEFDESTEGWTASGKGVIIEERISKEGNRFIAALNRTQPSDSFSQKVQLEKGMLYAFSGWVQVSEGSESVWVIFKSNGSQRIRGGQAIAKNGCWTLIKGGLFANFSGPVEILFESEKPTVEIRADSIALQPFTKEEWRSHQDLSIEKVRKSKVRFQVTHMNETAVEGAKVYIKQRNPGFPFGCGINFHILESPDYQKWFLARFKYATFTNEMKWYSTEVKQGQENYTTVDAMLKFAKDHGVSLRGHNILWDQPSKQPQWVYSLPPAELRKAADRRIKSVVLRYKGQLIHWDVVNENLHFRFFEEKLGEKASPNYYCQAYQLDPTTIMFMNEFCTIEYSGDQAAKPVNYKRKLEEIRSFPDCAGISLGIGLQGRFHAGQPNIAYMRAALDDLATTRLPIWLTEVSLDKGPSQAQYLEEVLREAYSHPAVEGIITFSGPAPVGFTNMTLTDENFQNTPAGDVVDKLLKEWKSGPLEVRADSRGFIDVSLFHGHYDITITHPITNSSKTLNLSVMKDVPQQTIHVKIHI